MTRRFFIFILLSLMLPAFHLRAQDENENGISFEIKKIKIGFKGVQSFDDGFLKDILVQKKGDVFDMSAFIQDAERLRKYYFDNGFFDAKVDTVLEFNDESEEVTENFIIRESERYKYKNVEYSGLGNLEEKVLEQIYRKEDRLVADGKYYSKDTIKLEVTRVLNVLYNNGYATASAGSPEVLKYETNIKELGHKVKVNLDFFPKLKYNFGTTQITLSKERYNVTVQDIRRELTYSENKVYNKEEVINSELNLSKISILENPRIVISDVDTVNRKVNLAINAVVGNKYDVTPEFFGYYFQNVFYLGTGLSFSDKYWLGGGRVLTTRARFYFHSLNNNRMELVNSVFQPFLFGNRNTSGNWNIGIEYNLDEDLKQARVKNNFAINHNLPNYTYINSINGRWDIENTRIILKHDIDVNETLKISKFDYNYFKSVLGFGLVHNSVNNIQFPFKGNYQSYSFEESGLLGLAVQKIFNTQTVSYFKFYNLSSAYLNLSNNDYKVAAALAGKFSTGIIIEYGDNTFQFGNQTVQADLVPTDTRFICGGSTSIRGWGAKQLGIVSDKSVGGNFLLENSIEHRVRPFLNASNIYFRDLGFASFIDFGNVWSTINKFRLSEIALAAGAGIRYYTIIGAIRFDVGFKVYDPQPGDRGGSHWIFGNGCKFSDKYNFQFGIGNTF